MRYTWTRCRPLRDESGRADVRDRRALRLGHAGGRRVYSAPISKTSEKTSTREQLKDHLRKHLEDVWQGTLMRGPGTMARESGAPYRIQAYFIVPSSGSPTLRFPFDVSYLPDFGSGEARQTDAFMWRDRNSTHSVITLPTGALRPASVPAPLTVTHEHGSGTGRWNLEGGKLHAK